MGKGKDKGNSHHRPNKQEKTKMNDRAQTQIMPPEQEWKTERTILHGKLVQTQDSDPTQS